MEVLIPMDLPVHNVLLQKPVQPQKQYYLFRVQCNRCGEVIEGRVDNDLSLNDESSG
ncbi:MAG TPA: hypothetical protein VNK49_05685 [Anaerolineales bacterium]|nr:hypothetical protein [Anaerolineales bacterium]